MCALCSPADESLPRFSYVFFPFVRCGILRTGAIPCGTSSLLHVCDQEVQNKEPREPPLTSVDKSALSPRERNSTRARVDRVRGVGKVPDVCGHPLHVFFHSADIIVDMRPAGHSMTHEPKIHQANDQLTVQREENQQPRWSASVTSMSRDLDESVHIVSGSVA